MARVGAGLLADPVPPCPDPVVLLTGQVLSVAGIVETFGGGLKYVDVSPQDWRERAMSLYGDAHVVAHLDKLWELFRLIGAHHELYQVTEAIERFGGRGPGTLAEFVRGRS
ncbi:hypothetical protein [Streptomyces sp. NPDC055189]